MPNKTPVCRLETLIFADLTINFAQPANYVDMDIDFFDHYEVLSKGHGDKPCPASKHH